MSQDAARRTGLEKRFEHAAADRKANTLSCHVESTAPRLAYSFRFFTGYYATFPARQLSTGKGNRIGIFFRVKTKLDGEYQYFFQPALLPPIPEDAGKTQLEVGGGFYVGEGTYSVDWLMVDQTDRICSRSWTIKAPHTKLELQAPAGSIAPLGLESWKGFTQQKATDARVTVFVSAMPIYRRRNLSKLSAFDRSLLLGSLTSILNTSNFGHARVVAFDLLGKRILFEQDEFDPSGYERLRDTLENVSYGTVDYRVLAKGVTNRDLFEKLVKSEIAKSDKSDTVIFLGAEGPPADKLPPVFAEYRESLASRLFYVFFARFPQPVEDLMYQFVHSGKGRVLHLFGPPDLLNAIKVISAGS